MIISQYVASMKRISVVKRGLLWTTVQTMIHYPYLRNMRCYVPMYISFAAPSVCISKLHISNDRFLDESSFYKLHPDFTSLFGYTNI